MNFFGESGLNEKLGLKEDEDFFWKGLGNFMLFCKPFPTSKNRLIKDFCCQAEAMIWLFENATKYFADYELVEGTDIGLKVTFFPGKRFS